MAELKQDEFAQATYQNEEQMFEGQPQQIAEPPITMVIECNKALAENDGYAQQPHAWTNKFPAIKLKKGDVVSVNSAFLSARGAGDLLQFDDTNHKTRLVFEYYGTNDNSNGKRAGYNLYGDGSSTPYEVNINPADGFTPTGREPCYPADYRPMKLYRLLETFDITALGNGNQLANFTDEDGGNYPGGAPAEDFQPQTSLVEPNWGYRRSNQQLVTGKEDDYVPGLLRHPTITLRESIHRAGEASQLPTGQTVPPYWGTNDNAHIWYISTSSSVISPCNVNASMRIHFQYGAGKGGEVNSSLGLLKKLRPGMILKFLDPEYLFGLRTASYEQRDNAGNGDIYGAYKVPGSNCYWCSGYAHDGHGIQIGGRTVDEFIQCGNPDQNHKQRQPWGIGSDLMKISKININTTLANIDGLCDDSTDITKCPWIEVICDRSYSVAFGDPNLNGNNFGYQGVPDPGDSTSGPTAYRYWKNLQSPGNAMLFRTWMGKGLKACEYNIVTNPWRETLGGIYTHDNITIANCVYANGSARITKPILPSTITADMRAYLMGTSIYNPTEPDSIDVHAVVVNITDNGADELYIDMSSNFVTSNTKDLSFLVHDTDRRFSWNPKLWVEMPGTMPAHDKSETDMYLMYKSWWYNTTSDARFNKSGMFARHDAMTRSKQRQIGNSTTANGGVATEVLDAPLDFQSCTGQFNKDQDGDHPTITPPNYNLRVLNRDQVTDDRETITKADFETTKIMGEDYFNKQEVPLTSATGSETYAGGRLPVSLNMDNPSNKDNYNDGSLYVKAHRQTTYSHGPYWQAVDIFNSFDQYNAGASIEKRSYMPINGVTRTDGVLAEEGFSRGCDKFPFITQNTNETASIFLNSDHGVPIRFYFSKPIRSDETHFKGGNLMTQAYADRGGMTSWGDITQTGVNQTFPDGLNFVGATAHAPSPRYSGVPNTRTDTKNGIDYGLNIEDAVTENNNAYALNQYNLTTKQDKGCDDMRRIMSQVEHSFYAYFVNNAGQTEVMLIWCCAMGEVNYNKKGAYNDRTINYQRRMFCTEKINAGYSAVDKLNRDINPGIMILRRDVLNQYEGQALPAFEGNGDTTNFNTYNSVVRRDIPPPNLGSYFHIIDSLANTAHKVTFRDKTKDVVSLTGANGTSSYAYQNIIANPVDPQKAYDNTNFIGGGDFCLTLDPQLPYMEGARGAYDDYTIPLFIENIELTDSVVAPTFGANPVAGNIGKLTWGIHYDFVDLDVKRDDSDVYFSTSDVATKITKQMREPTDLFRSDNGGGKKDANGTVPNTAGKYPVNSLFRPILGPSNTTNIEGTNGVLEGNYEKGSFIFFKDMATRFIDKIIYTGNLSSGGEPLLNPFFDINNPIPEGFKGDGIYPIFPRNIFTKRNIAPSTNSVVLTGHGNSGTNNAGCIGFLTAENVTRTNASTLRENPQSVNGCAMAQFIGTSQPQLIYNDQNSRFEFQYFHQPVYSFFNMNSNSGGDEVCRIWANQSDRMENWTRYGGINVVNWCADPNVSFNQYGSVRDIGYIDPRDKTLPNANSQLFMNKLGFTYEWLQENVGETTYQEDANDRYKGYKPKGTTDALYDITNAVNYLSDEPSKYYHNIALRNNNTTLSSAGANVGHADIDKANYLLNIYNGTADYPTHPVKEPTYPNANQTGGPFNQWGGDLDGTADNQGSKLEPFNPSRTMGENLAYGLPNSLNTPKAVIAVPLGNVASTPKSHGTFYTNGTASKKKYTDLNLDDVKLSYYSYSCSSDGLSADSIPSKTKIGYYLIMSDLIDKHEFIGSANGGNPLNCIGVLSKNYENNDFYYSFQSPVEFYIKADKTITQIETRILQPDLNIPVGLDTNSSIIYTIVRQNNVPEPDVPPIAIQQALDYALQSEMDLMSGYGGAFGGYMGISNLMGSGSGAGAGLNSLRQSLVQSVLQPGPHQANEIYGTESDIQMNLLRANLGTRQAILQQQVGAEDPADMAVIGQSSEQQQARIEEVRQPDQPFMDRMIDPSKPYFSEDFSPPPQRAPPPRFSAEASPVRHAGGRRGRSMSAREAEAEAKHISARSPAPNYSPAVGGPLGTFADPFQPPASDEEMRMKPRADMTLTHFPLPSPMMGGGARSPSPPPRRQLDAGNYLTELAKDFKGDGGRKLRQKIKEDVGRGVNFNDPQQLPIDVIKHVHESGDLLRDGIVHRLDPQIRQYFHDELRHRQETGFKRGQERGLTDPDAGEGPAIPKAKTPQLPPDTFQPPPETHGSDGRISLFNWAHNAGKMNSDNWKGQNQYDIHTWDTSKLKSIARHEEKGDGNELWTIGSGVDGSNLTQTGETRTQLRNRYKAEKASDPDHTAHKWRAHLLRHADRHLIQSELDRRNTPGAHGKLTFLKKGSKYRSDHRVHAPANYQRSAPHQTPRGLGRDRNMGPLPAPDSITGGPPKQKPQ